MSRMPPPDFSRVRIDAAQKQMPAGDPTLWAGQVVTPVGDTPGVFNGNQIILAQAADRYARSWSLSGTVTCPSHAWTAPGAATAPNFPDPAGSTTRLEVWISVLQGIEMLVVEHLILLTAGTPYGLCQQQHTSQNGPYGSTFTSPLPEAGQESRGFAAIGALIGNTISVRAIYARGAGGLISSAAVACILTPYAPGQGI